MPSSDKFCRLFVSIPDAKEARAVVDALLKKKLIAGSLISSGPSRYWWDGEIVEKTYYNLNAFTKLSLKKKIEAVVRPLQSDKVPVIVFTEIVGANQDCLDWIEENTFSD